MIIIYNAPGALMGGASLVALLAVSSLTDGVSSSLGSGLGGIAMGAVLFGLDYVYRNRRAEYEDEPWTSVQGGSLFFVPCYAWGAVAILVGIYNLLFG